MKVSPKLVSAALASARDAGLDEAASEVRLISWILARGRIAQKLEKIGGCPAEFKDLFARQKRAWKEQDELNALLATRAASRRANPL